jgi:hypothetical protein
MAANRATQNLIKGASWCRKYQKDQLWEENKMGTVALWEEKYTKEF